jgi:acetylornithine deacetylase
MNSPIDPLPLLLSLIRLDSVSDRDNLDITDTIGDRLAEIGFEICRCDYTDENGVPKANLVATRYPIGGDVEPCQSGPSGESGRNDPADLRGAGVAYFSHTDVVPVEQWDGPGGAFDPVVQDGRVYGRGSCDMKGSLVAMIAAASRIDRRQQTAPIRIICTADEEIGFYGARELVARCPEYRRMVESQPVAIIGEPTGCEVMHAHKGIVGFHITSHGRAAHSSSRDGINANIAMVPMLVELLRLYELSESDPRFRDARFDPPTVTWNFGVSDHCTAVNVTPAKSVAWVALRTMPEIDGEELIDAIRAKAAQLGLHFHLYKGGPPMWVDPDNPVVRAMCELAGCAKPQTVCYATDGGEFSGLRDRVVCGPGDIAQAHTSDEWLSLDQLARGVDLYHRVLQRWCVRR